MGTAGEEKRAPDDAPAVVAADGGEGVRIAASEGDSLTRDPKATEDYSSESTELRAKLDGCDTAEAFDALVGEVVVLEKRARQANDGASVSRILLGVLNCLARTKRWAQVNEWLTTYTKKRGQLMRVTTDVVRSAMAMVDSAAEGAERMALVETLAAVSSEKIFIEMEHARIVKRQADLLEKAGRAEEASVLLQEVQVDTISGMSARERAEYVIEQLRLVMLRKDYVRFQMISKTINVKTLKNKAAELQDIALCYYRYLMRYYLERKEFMDVARSAQECLETPVMQVVLGLASEKDESALRNAKTLDFENVFRVYMPELEGMPAAGGSDAAGAASAPLAMGDDAVGTSSAMADGPNPSADPRLFRLAQLLLSYQVLSLALDAFSEERLRQLRECKAQFSKTLAATPPLLPLVNDLLSDELIGGWPLAYSEELRRNPWFVKEFESAVPEHAGADERWDTLRSRVLEHNVMTLSKYYTRITLTKLAGYCARSPADAVAAIARLVNAGGLRARVDRPNDVVSFTERASTAVNDTLDSWAKDVSQMLDMVQETTHLINNERMMSDTVAWRKAQEAKVAAMQD